MYGYGFLNSFKNISGAAFDPDALAFITAYSITDATQISAINQAVVSLKSGTLWGKGDVILPYVGSSATAHRGNLKTATNGCTFNGGITHNSNGVTYNGTTGYAEINYLLTASNIYNRSVFQYIRNVTTDNTKSWQGAFNGSFVFGYQACISGGSYKLIGDGLNRLNTNSLALNYGMIGASISSISSAKIYNKTSIVVSIMITGNAPSNNLKMFSGALNSSGSPAFYGDHNIAFEYYGQALTDAEALELNNIMVAFNTSLSRNV